VYFMSTSCGCPQGGGDPAQVDACEQREGGQKLDVFVVVINGWPLCLKHGASAEYCARNTRKVTFAAEDSTDKMDSMQSTDVVLGINKKVVNNVTAPSC